MASTVFADSYLWNTSAQNDEIIITEPGENWLQIEKEGCTTSDTIQIFGDPVPFDLGNDTTICKGEELNLILPAEATYIWQDGRQGFEYQISQADFRFLCFGDFHLNFFMKTNDSFKLSCAFLAPNSANTIR